MISESRSEMIKRVNAVFEAGHKAQEAYERSAGVAENEKSAAKLVDEADKVYLALMVEAGETPEGSPLRKAIGNMFTFDFPECKVDEWEADISNFFLFTSKNCYPSGGVDTDCAVGLDELNENLEPFFDEPTVVFNDMDPQESIDWLLTNGFTYKHYRYSKRKADPSWLKLLKERQDALGIV